MGKAKLDAVLFAGNGVTGAVGLLVDCLGLRGAAAARAGGGDSDRDAARPVVFVGPHEHHSNRKHQSHLFRVLAAADRRHVAATAAEDSPGRVLVACFSLAFFVHRRDTTPVLPWRESGCEVVTVPEDPRTGRLDLRALDRLLLRARGAGARAPGGGRLLVGAFAAVSNVTGLIADVDRIAVLLHRHGAVACFDYASGAPYLRMDANPPSGGALAAEGWEEEGAALGEEAGPADPSKDALYFSPHKCYGGTSTPGVLVIKKHVSSARAWRLARVRDAERASPACPRERGVGEIHGWGTANVSVDCCFESITALLYSRALSVPTLFHHMPRKFETMHPVLYVTCVWDVKG